MCVHRVIRVKCTAKPEWFGAWPGQAKHSIRLPLEFLKKKSAYHYRNVYACVVFETLKARSAGGSCNHIDTEIAASYTTANFRGKKKFYAQKFCAPAKSCLRQFFVAGNFAMHILCAKKGSEVIIRTKIQFTLDLCHESQ